VKERSLLGGRLDSVLYMMDLAIMVGSMHLVGVLSRYYRHTSQETAMVVMVAIRSMTQNRSFSQRTY